jgi:hypothetical protein
MRKVAMIWFGFANHIIVLITCFNYILVEVDYTGKSNHFRPIYLTLNNWGTKVFSSREGCKLSPREHLTVCEGETDYSNPF